jgi:hypothetical protein
MLFMSAAKACTNALSQLVRRQQASGFSHSAFAMKPVRFNWVEPRALGRQATTHNAHSLPCLLDLGIVSTQPLTHLATGMPRGIIPDQQQGLLSSSFQTSATPTQELCSEATDGPAIHKAQPDFLLSLAHARQQQPIAGQGLGVAIPFRRTLFYQSQWLPLLSPSLHAGLGQTTPPGLIFEAQHPFRVALCQDNQPVSSPFFEWYAGSGLVIQALARCQRIPRRSRAWRMVSTLTCREVMPWAKATSANRDRVHTLVGWPKSRGLRCTRSRNFSLAWSSTTAWIRCGRHDLRRKHSKPRAWKSAMMLRTVWSLQPTSSAISLARRPRALASRIWHRRRTNTSDERNPASNCMRSASSRGRTKIGGLIHL